jgi:hypothetical protein
MSFRPALPFMLTAALIFGGSALAKRPTEFQAPQQMTEEELAAAKERSKSKLNGFEEKGEERPTCLPWGKNAPNCIPFPWMALGLAGLAFLVTAPFALRAFKNTSREISGAERALGNNRASPD